MVSERGPDLFGAAAELHIPRMPTTRDGELQEADGRYLRVCHEQVQASEYFSNLFIAMINLQGPPAPPTN